MDQELLTRMLAFSSMLSVFVLAAVQLVKVSVTVPKKLIPLMSVVVGMAVGAVAYPFTDLHLALRLWAGALSGLSATGLFEAAFNKPRTGSGDGGGEGTGSGKEPPSAG
ncbi:holin [Gorillibacterium sp. sgz500922]|uniref:holin n=1 Tax=Gorillibacterium sp. sgz500922 TaxID=3446694 RepID=UPI003F66871B